MPPQEDVASAELLAEAVAVQTHLVLLLLVSSSGES